MAATDLTSVDEVDLPLVLAAVHRRSVPGERLRLRWGPIEPARRYDLVTGAGFASEVGDASLAYRIRSLPDTVGAGMTLLICGLNPSPAAADAGIGFHRPGNRFWPAARGAGLVTRDRDPDDALRTHGVGMTDLVKRTTRRADELDAHEYRAGLDRVDRLAAWLQPAAICFVGLAGWRVAVDRRATAGHQDRRLGDRPVYVMPSTSGLNARTTLDELTGHLRAARDLARAAPAPAPPRRRRDRRRASP